MCTEELCTEELCTEELCTKELCTEELCTEELCTEELCTEELCTEELLKILESDLSFKNQIIKRFKIYHDWIIVEIDIDHELTLQWKL